MPNWNYAGRDLFIISGTYREKRTKYSLLRRVTNKISKSRLVARNTVEYFTPDGRRIIRYHDTDIITFFPDGSILLDSSKWRTRSTKARLNDFGKGFMISQKKWKWYVHSEGRKFEFYDGIVLFAKPKWRV